MVPDLNMSPISRVEGGTRTKIRVLVIKIRDHGQVQGSLNFKTPYSVREYSKNLNEDHRRVCSHVGGSSLRPLRVHTAHAYAQCKGMSNRDPTENYNFTVQ